MGWQSCKIHKENYWRMYLKYSYKIIIYYFFFCVIAAIFKIINIDIQFDKIFDVAILLIIISGNWGKIRTIDYWVIAYMVYLLFTVVINDYPNKAMITYYAIKTTWIPILLFFVGEKRLFVTDVFFKKMILPVTISLIFGIFFFITMPSWYVNMKMAFLPENAPEDLVNELFRMSSFWSAPQFIGYSTFILYTYLLSSLYRSHNTKLNKYKILVLILCLLSIFLIQLRVVIAGCAISTIFFIIWNYLYGDKNKNAISFYMIIVIVLLVIFIFSLSTIVHVDFLKSKIESIFSFQDTASQRVTSMQGAKAARLYSVNLLGYGMGRFGIAVSQFKMPDMRDGGYLKELMESGYLGFSIFVIILISTLIRLIRNIRYLPFEFAILIFYLIALIGANCISEGLNMIFWLNLGRIWSNKLLTRNHYLWNINRKIPRLNDHLYHNRTSTQIKFKTNVANN